MKYCRFKYNNKNYYGKIEGDFVIPFKGDYNIYSCEQNAISLRNVKILSPARPSKIIAIGVNFYSHAKEMDLQKEIKSQPLIFLKPPSAVIGPEDFIVYPSVSNRLDYEAEIAVVIKKECKNVSEKEADEYILGYTCCNDVTCRDLQMTDNQWSRCKGFDTFAPIGPYIISDIDVSDLEIKAILNGKTVQSGNTNQMINNINRLVSYISSIMTLFPEDVITCGTPSGIGPMQRGDTIEISIDQIGVLRNYIK